MAMVGPPAGGKRAVAQAVGAGGRVRVCRDRCSSTGRTGCSINGMMHTAPACPAGHSGCAVPTPQNHWLAAAGPTAASATAGGVTGTTHPHSRRLQQGAWQRACISALWQYGIGGGGNCPGRGRGAAANCRQQHPACPPAGHRLGGGSPGPRRGIAGLAGRRGSRAGLQPRPTRSPSANLNWCPAACPLPAVWQHGATGGSITMAHLCTRSSSWPVWRTGFNGGPAGCNSRL